MQNAKDDGLIAGYLRRIGAIGRHNSMIREKVAVGVGLSSARQVSKVLEDERVTTVICSWSKGLFLPSDDAEGDAEVRRYIETVSRKGAGAFKSIAAARRYLKEVRGQEAINDVIRGEISTSADTVHGDVN